MGPRGLMGRLPTLLLAAATAAGLTVASVATVTACTCMVRTPAEAHAAADVVVEGEVIRVSPPQRASVTYTVAVERVHKGKAAELLEVVSAQDSAACGVVMAVGQRWRLYLHDYDGQLTTWACDGTELLADDAPAPSAPPGNGSHEVSPLSTFVAAIGSVPALLLTLLLAWLGIGTVR